MDIDKVLINDMANSRVIRDEVSKAQTPGTPVASNLADDKLAFGFGFRDSLVYLLDGIDVLVIDFLERSLSVCRQGKESCYYCQNQIFLHITATLLHSQFCCKDTTFSYLFLILERKST